MKCSETWLREWVNPSISSQELCEVLTMGGFEVEEITPVADVFTNVIVGEIIEINEHPEAERLQVCRVNVGKEILQIVCAATNVRVGMKTAVALINAKLPNNNIITQTTIRHVTSMGMLCSAADLGLSDDNEGIIHLPLDAPTGEDLRKYFNLFDNIIDISITPNRGDCLSIKGMAREIAALTNTNLNEVSISQTQAEIDTIVPITTDAKAECPRYVGRIIRGIKPDVTTPIWLTERLRRSGVRSISPIVDVTNYVMLELGQPMHAFDLQMIDKEIIVRNSQAGEKIALLDGSEQTLDSQTLVIADKNKPLAIAGVMGGLDSSVTLLTQDIFLESAYFSPRTIARQRQFYNLNSESAYRFERGVDPSIQRLAIERATQLILEIAGGKAGPMMEVQSIDQLPLVKKIRLDKEKITSILGINIPDHEISAIFKRMKFSYEVMKKDHHAVVWEVAIPSYRFDVTLPEDLIEDIARMYGYSNIPSHQLKASLDASIPFNHQDRTVALIRESLRHQGFHEIISYSFIDKKLQKLLDKDQPAFELVNPITSDMSVMRTNLWPGLVKTLLYNKSRQQDRVRLFEMGTCFIMTDDGLQQQPKVGGLISGLAYREQWGEPKRKADFYDLKGNLENVLSLVLPDTEFDFQAGKHPSLHPGKTAIIYHNNQKVGILGAVHPHILQAIDITDNDIFLFELDLTAFPAISSTHYHEFSKFPEIRRDIALLVNQAVPAKAIRDTINTIAGDWLKEVFIFDLYHGKGVSPNLKSIALALILQHPSRTLVDAEVTELMQRVITTLKVQLGAELRS